MSSADPESSQLMGGHGRAPLPYVPGELIVQFQAQTAAAQRTYAVRAARGRVERVLSHDANGLRRTVLVTSSTQTTAALAEALRSDPAVLAVAPNYLRHVDAVPLTEPGLALQWGLAAVNAPDAWDFTTGSPDVVVASIDTGVDVLHPDLAPNVWHNPGETAGNGIDDDGNGYVDDVYGIDAWNNDVHPMDDDGHGTHTSGIMAAVGGDGAGVSGISWHAQVMALKFLSCQGWGDDAGAIECIDYVIHEKVDDGVNVVAINASWGGPEDSLPLRNAVKAAGEAGIVFCASAGNDSVNDDVWSHYPSGFDCPNIVSVCAADGERLAGYSNWGVLTTDIAAPGTRILSTLKGATYAVMSGTSMATPQVTGTVALRAALYPGETAQQRIAAILDSTRPKPWLEGVCMSGGELDAAAALGLADPSTDVTPPVTTALGFPDVHADTYVEMQLYPADGPGGSGVASTQWRVNGGRWKEGTRIGLEASWRMLATRSVDFRSTDRAGNVEYMKTVSVTFDTRLGADDAEPGLPLPASPVKGTAGWPDRVDIYRVYMDAGQILKLSPADPLLTDFAVSIFKAGSKTGGAMWMSRFTEGLAYKATVTGRYYLHVGSGPYAFAWQIYPKGVDVIPPRAFIDGPGSWRNAPVTLTFTMSDAGGAGPGVIEGSLDDGLTWAPMQQVTIDAPADHSNDGRHWVLARAIDGAGNRSAVVSKQVLIDTEGPATKAWGPIDPVERGSRVRVRFTLDDRSETVFCVLIVRSALTGNVVLRHEIGWTEAAAYPDPWTPGPFRHSYRFLCDLPKGEYNLYIAGATRDEASNRWTNRTCERQLIVE